METSLARTREGWRVDAHLIIPVQEPVGYTGDRRGPDGEPASMPPIGCAAYPTSFEPAREPDRDESTLAVVWFQDEFAFPIDGAVLERLRAVDREHLATDTYV